MTKNVVCIFLTFMMVTGLFSSSFTGLSKVYAVTPTDGLLLWYKMDDTSGTTVNDSSGNGLNGIVKGGASWVDGIKKGAIKFNGKDGYIEIPGLGNKIKDLGDFTISTYVKINTSRDYQRIFDFGTPADGKFMCMMPKDKNEWAKGFVYDISSSGGGMGKENVVETGSELKTGEWINVAIVVSGNIGTLYENGVKIATNTIPIKPSDLGNTIQNYIGKSIWAGDPFLDGEIDDFRIYNKALSQDQIDSIVNLSDDESVFADKSALDLGNMVNVVADLKLPISGSHGTTISWASSDKKIIGIDGEVKRPKYKDGDATVTLTGTIVKGNAQETKLFSAKVIKKTAESKISEFKLDKISLLDGIFKEKRDINLQVMNAISADTILYAFRYNTKINYGVTGTNFDTIPGKSMAGWGDPKSGFAGHLEGHYLSAIALSYANMKDPALKTKAEAIVDGLEEIQNKMTPKNAGETIGYLSAFPETRFDDLEAGRYAAVPWYMIHKIMAGLLDVYKYCGYQKALDVGIKMANWASWRSSRLSDAEWQACLAREEFGGMNDVLVNYYDITGNEDYKVLAHRFEQPNLLNDLYNGKDNLSGYHANTYLAKIVGAARTYKVEKDDIYSFITKNFWNFVNGKDFGRMYVIGGNSVAEGFGPANNLSHELSPNTAETCNVYNMLKITRSLFTWSGNAQYADYYERALFNQILGSMDDKGDKTYYQYMDTNSKKVFNSTTNNAFCCNGTGMESFSKLQDSIYFHDKDSLYVNLFIASQVDWTQKGISLKQTTKFPVEQGTTLEISASSHVKMAINVRVPYWATNGFDILINGVKQNVTAIPSSYITLDRTWNNRDKIEIRMPMSIHMEATTDNPSKVAFLYGPTVMVGVNAGGSDVLTANKLDKNSWYNNLQSWFKPIDGGGMVFNATDNDGRVVNFKPYYSVLGENYTTYWNIEKVVEGSNVALGKTAEASGSYNSDYDASKAIDGKMDTRWCAPGIGMPQWLTVDLKDDYYITACRFNVEKLSTWKYKLEYSSDKQNWYTYADKSDNNNEMSTYTDFKNVTARYIRLTINGTSKNAWASLYEFQIYGGKIGTIKAVNATTPVSITNP